jgi:hypothetical protein
MGLITGLLTLPLAPMRGTVWIAERIHEQAEEGMNDETAIRTGLIELEAAREAGDLSDEEIDAAENELLERLIASRGLMQEDWDGAIE